MGTLPRDEAYVIAFWLGTLLLGVHTVVFILYLWFCWGKHSVRNIHLLLTATALFIIGTINNIIALQRVIGAFWGNTGRTAEEYLNNTKLPSNYIESTTWFLQVVVGDAVLTYRCWIVYARHWWALIPPAAFIVGTFTMGILLQVEYSKVHSNDSSNAETTKDLTRWEGPMIILTVILNISLTIAISGRIWWKYRKLARLLNDRTQRRHFQTVWLAVESGVVIAITQIVLLILGALSSPGYQIIAHAVTPLIGIAFTGIILRVQLSPRDCDYSIETGALDTIVPTTVDDAIIQEVTPASDYELRRITFDAKTSELDLCESRVESTEPP